MSFWADKIGVQQAPAPAPAPASNQPWWMPGRVPQQTPHPVVQQPVPTPQQQVQQVSVDPNQEAHFGDLLRQDGYTTEKAPSAKDGEHCPACGSPNYLRIGGLQSRTKRCFECGHNEMFTHSTAGASGIGQKGVAPPRPARVQVNAPPAGFPATGSVVDHV